MKIQQAHRHSQSFAEPRTSFGQDVRAPIRVPANAVAQRDGGDVGLQAAALAAGACRTVRVDHNMADLAGRMVVAIHELVVQQHRRADAPGDLHKQAVGIAVPEEVVGEQRGVRVVVHSGRQRELAFEHVAKFHVVPAEIGTGDHPPRAGDHAGDCDADADKPRTGKPDHLAHKREHIVEIDPVAIIKHTFATLHDSGPQIHHGTGHHIRARQIDAYQTKHVRIDGQQGARLATAIPFPRPQFT